jgi:hypothetical protein
VCSEINKSSTINKSNAQHAILFEAISLILALDCSRDLLASSVNSLGRFLSVKVSRQQQQQQRGCVWPVSLFFEVTQQLCAADGTGGVLLKEA